MVLVHANGPFAMIKNGTRVVEQNGFRREKDCAQNVIPVTELTKNAVKENKELHLIYIDLVKAVDNR